MPERGSETNDGTAVLLGEVQAALWLSESLILALLEANLLDTDTILEAIDIVNCRQKDQTRRRSRTGSRGSDKACLDQRQHRRREDDRQSGRSKTERANPSEAFNLTVTPGPALQDASPAKNSLEPATYVADMPRRPAYRRSRSVG